MRIKQHEVEDISRGMLQVGIPRNWVYRDKDKDYGIDAEIEIFDKEGKATGIVFWVQLKATESKEQSRIDNLDLNIERINYYKKLDIPVMILRYSDYHKSFKYKWIYEIDTYYSKKDAKTLRVKFEEENTFDSSSYDGIENYLKRIDKVKKGNFKFPLETFISSESSSIPKYKLRMLLNKYNEFIRISEGKENAEIILKISDDELIISFGHYTGCIFHIDENIIKEENSLIELIFLGISLIFLNLGYNDLSSRIIVNNNLENKVLEFKEFSILLIKAMINSSYYKTGFEILERYLDLDDDNFETLAQISIIYDLENPETKKKYIEKSWNKIVEKYVNRDEKVKASTALYNIGNFYKNNNNLKAAARKYIKAKKYSKIYDEAFHFYKELAGIFFCLERFSIAEKLYRKAISIKSDLETKGLLADTLMFLGKVEESKKIFDDYLDSKINDEWLLKSILLENIILNMKITNQKRQVEEALKYASIQQKKDENEIIKKLEIALKYDILCGLAWYNLGHTYYVKKDYYQSSYCYLMCAVVQNYDIEAWVNAILTGFSAKKEIEIELIALMIRNAYSFNGDNFLSSFYETLNENMEHSEASRLIESLDEHLHSSGEISQKLIVRLLNEKGDFKEIAL